jgi:outer membrane lipoprotein-sorting protein
MSNRSNLMLFLMIPFLIYGGDPAPRDVIRHVEKTLTSSRTVKVVFKETYIWTLTGEKQSLRGELLIMGEDRFFVNTEDQIIVSDGELLWTYSIPSERVLIDHLGVTDETLLPRQILFHFQEDYDIRLTGSETINEHDCWILHFTSQTGADYITEVKVWVDQKKWIPWKIEQTGMDENKTIFTLHEVQLGIEIPENRFQFTVPEGVDVIDMR